MKVYNQKSKIQKKLPHAMSAMILGIVSITLCFVYGAGIVVARIAKRQVDADMKIFRESPLEYSKSYKLLRIGEITSKVGFWVGIGVTIMLVVFIIAYMGIILLYAVNHNPPTHLY
jgi:hypothetical protein